MFKLLALFSRGTGCLKRLISRQNFDVYYSDLEIIISGNISISEPIKRSGQLNPNSLANTL